jgi:hypothetical protein
MAIFICFKTHHVELNEPFGFGNTQKHVYDLKLFAIDKTSYWTDRNTEFLEISCSNTKGRTDRLGLCRAALGLLLPEVQVLLDPILCPL